MTAYFQGIYLENCITHLSLAVYVIFFNESCSKKTKGDSLFMLNMWGGWIDIDGAYLLMLLILYVL